MRMDSLSTGVIPHPFVTTLVLKVALVEREIPAEAGQEPGHRDEEISIPVLCGKGNQRVSKIPLGSWASIPLVSESLLFEHSAAVLCFSCSQAFLRNLGTRGSEFEGIRDLLAKSRLSCQNQKAQNTPTRYR